MLNRLLIQLPLLIITILLMTSLIVPIIYWLITGKDPVETYFNTMDNILDIELW